MQNKETILVTNSATSYKANEIIWCQMYLKYNKVNTKIKMVDLDIIIASYHTGTSRSSESHGCGSKSGKQKISHGLPSPSFSRNH